MKGGLKGAVETKRMQKRSMEWRTMRPNQVVQPKKWAAKENARWWSI